MRTIDEIDKDIAEVKDELADLHGEPTEVYARIVGYYRSVRNWNKGKKQEYGERKMFDTNASQLHSIAVDIKSICEKDADFKAKMIEVMGDDNECVEFLNG